MDYKELLKKAQEEQAEKIAAPENGWKVFNRSTIEGCTNYVRPIRKF